MNALRELENKEIDDLVAAEAQREVRTQGLIISMDSAAPYCLLNINTTVRLVHLTHFRWLLADSWVTGWARALALGISSQVSSVD